MKLYYAKKKGIEWNTNYPYSAEVNNVDELEQVVCFDNMCACMKNNHREAVNFLSADSLAFDADNTHSDEPDDWITFDDVADTFHEVRFYAVESRNHMKVKNGKAPRPKYHFYFPLSHLITDGEKYKDLIMKATALYPYFDTNALDVSRYYNSVGDDPKCIYIDGDLTLDQFLESVSLEEVEKALTDFEFLQSEHDRLFEYFGFDKPDTLGGNKFAKSTGFVLPETIEFGERNDTLYRFACSLQARAYPDDEIRCKVSDANENRCKPPLNKSELDKTIKSALKHPKGHSNNNPVILPGGNEVSDVMQMLKVKRRELNGEIVATPIDTIDNVVTILENDKRFKGKIRTNILANCPYYFGDIPWRTRKDELDTMGEWNDTDDAELRRVIQNEYGIIRLSKQNYNDGFRIVADNNSFNPLVDYFEELPKWDGVERIKHLLPDYLGAEDSEYTYEVMRLVMLGALSRAYNPGCKFDYMLVLVGSQGIGKSYFLKKLAINDIWFEDGIQTSLDKKDAVEKMRGKWIIEFGEMAALKSTKDVEAIKSFTTVCTDTYREPYARRTTERKRMCVFTGTTNNMRFLTDRTGNRRFLPIVVTGKKTKNLFDDDTDEYINMAWSEALYLFNQANRKPLLVLPERLAAEVLQHQENHKEDNPAVGLVQYYLDNRVDGYPVCAVEIAEKVLGIELGKVKRSTVNEIHDIMKYEIHGWELAHNQKCGKYGSQKNCYIKKVEWQEVTEDSFDD